MPSPPALMTCIEIEKPGGPEVLRAVERQVPAPKGNEALLQVAYAGVNRPEVLQRLGLYPPPPGASDIPGLEASGTVVAVGEDVAGLAVGDRVCALLTGGGYGEYAIADAGSCLPAPQRLSMAEAAALPETCFTVWANVFDDAALTTGETLLVHGGTSGIGVTAIAMAQAMGAKVIATASSAEKCDSIRAMGAEAYNYAEDSWDEAIAAAGGVDVVLDMAGGDFVARNLTCLKPQGRHVSIAFLRGPKAEINIMEIMRKRLRLSGSTMKARDFAEKARLARDLRTKVWPLIEAGAIRPVMDQTFPLTGAADAHRRMESGGHVGKIVLEVAKE